MEAVIPFLAVFHAIKRKIGLSVEIFFFFMYS